MRLRADPDRGQRLSEGLLVEASVVARVLRIRLLVINASVIVGPAQVEGRTRPTTYGGGVAQRQAIGAGLAAAERCLNEGADSLARSRR